MSSQYSLIPTPTLNKLVKFVEQATRTSPDVPELLICKEEWMRRTGRNAHAWNWLARTAGYPVVRKRTEGKKNEVMVDWAAYCERYK